MAFAPMAALALLAAWTAACLWFPLTDTDIWWHLAAAEWMAEHGAVPRIDPFSQTAYGKPWIDLHWGFQWIAHALWTLGGAAALVAAKVAVAAAALSLALATHWKKENAWFLLPLAAFGVYHVRFLLDMRPLVFTLLGLSALYACTMAHLAGRLRRPWLALVPIQILLANIQGLYPLGAFLVTALGAGAWLEGRKDALRSLGPACAALWLAGLATPYGWPGFVLPLALLARITPLPGNVFSSGIAENQPLHALAAHDPLAALPFLVLFLAVGWTFLRARPFSPGHLILFLAFAALGAMAQRNLPLLLLAGLFAAGRNLQVSQAAGRPARPAFDLAALAALAFIAGFHGPRIREAWRYELPGSLETPFRFPSRAAAFLAEHPLPGRIFNELRFGGYLALLLYPEVKPFVDGRMILRDAEFYREFLAVVDRPERFPDYASRHGLTHALLPIAEDKRYLPLAAFLIRESGWSLLFCDGAAVLLADSATAAAAGLPAQPPDAPTTADLEARFGANPRLEAIAKANLEEFLRQAENNPAGP